MIFIMDIRAELLVTLASPIVFNLLVSFLTSVHFLAARRCPSAPDYFHNLLVTPWYFKTQLAGAQLPPMHVRQTVVFFLLSNFCALLSP